MILFYIYRDISPRKLFEGETSIISPIKDLHFRDTPLKNSFENSPLNPMNIRLDFPDESIFITLFKYRIK